MSFSQVFFEYHHRINTPFLTSYAVYGLQWPCHEHADSRLSPSWCIAWSNRDVWPVPAQFLSQYSRGLCTPGGMVCCDSLKGTSRPNPWRCKCADETMKIKHLQLCQGCWTFCMTRGGRWRLNLVISYNVRIATSQAHVVHALSQPSQRNIQYCYQ